jgi:hypothetical protein
MEYRPESKIPALIDLVAPDGFIEHELTVTVGTPNESNTGQLKLYFYGKIQCHSDINANQIYATNWCGYFPVLSDGMINKKIMHGCSEGDKSKIIQ